MHKISAPHRDAAPLNAAQETPRGAHPLPRVHINSHAGEMTEGHTHARSTLTPMTDAACLTEQLWLLTDCGRWAGLRKVMTVTFNLPNPHTPPCYTHTQKYTRTHNSQHHWHYNMSSAPHPACLITILSAGDPRGNKSRADDLTDLPLPRGAVFFFPPLPPVETHPKCLLLSHLIQPKPRQAPAGHTLMTSSWFSPLPRFRCGCHQNEAGVVVTAGLAYQGTD